MPDAPTQRRSRWCRIASATTVSEAARSLGLSRVHFQTILHRAVAGLVTAMAPKPGGRPGRPEALVQLQAELARAKRENARLASQVASTGRLLSVASELLQGRMRPTTRRKRVRRSGGASRDGGEDAVSDRHPTGTPEEREAAVSCGVDHLQGFLFGRPEWLDVAITYGILNLIGTLAVLKFFRHGDLAHDVEDET